VAAIAAGILAAASMAASPSGAAPRAGVEAPVRAVAWVDGSPILDATFDHWMVIAASVSSDPKSKVTTPVPRPPRYRACVVALRRQLALFLKGKALPTTGQLRRQCAEEYQSELEEVMQFLVSAQWVLHEAAADGIRISDAAVARRFAAIRREQFPTRRAYQDFLDSSGEDRGDLLLRVRLELLGYYLYEVTRIHPAVQQTLAQVAPTIRAQLLATDRDQALTVWVKAFHARWTARTACRQGFVVADCREYRQTVGAPPLPD
jgi:hypothetical protein